MKLAFAVAAAVCSLLAAPSTAAVVVQPFSVATLEQTRTDTQIADDVIRTVNTYSRFTIFDHVHVDVQHGVVALTGRVTMPFKKDEIGKRAAGVDGVKAIRNDIGVLPPSPFDEELRHKVARAIYGNAAFWRYAAMPNPPIHIVVEGGRVTLIGVVHSEVDRALARSLATGQGELSLTNALRTDAQLRH